MLGKPAAVPFSFAPTGFTRMMHHEGERAVVRVAERRGIPYALSTMGTTSIEDVAKAAPDARKWFQLYVWKDRSAGEDLMARAKAAGYEALQLTVDVPVAGARLRDARNGFAIPPALTVKTVLDAATHPAWWMNLLTTEPLTFASLSPWSGTVGDLLDKLFDPTMTIADLEWLRASWDGPLIIKGIQTVEDARRVTDAGADAIVLSNHGGRQLDRAPVPLRLLPDVAEAVGDRTEVWVDTGIMSGADIVAALALGADATMVGRAYLYGLMAGGERGVDRAAEILDPRDPPHHGPARRHARRRARPAARAAAMSPFCCRGASAAERASSPSVSGSPSDEHDRARPVLEVLAAQAIELPSWAFGNAGTRFKVFSTPGTPRTIQEKLADAAQVNRLTGLAPSVALHIPWDLVDDYAELARVRRRTSVCGSGRSTRTRSRTTTTSSGR